MARIAGVDLPREKRIEYALPLIYGVGISSAKKIVAQAGVDPNTRVRDLTEAESSRLREIIERELPRRRRPAPGDAAQYPAANRDRVLSGNATPSRITGARSTYEDERAHPEGSEAGCSR